MTLKKKFYIDMHCGESYSIIAEKLDAPVKSIDNAIQRIRKKAARSILQDEKF